MKELGPVTQEFFSKYSCNTPSRSTDGSVQAASFLEIRKGKAATGGEPDNIEGECGWFAGITGVGDWLRNACCSRRSETEVDLCRSRTVEALMRAKSRAGDD
jgi:hypothetical protein